MVVKSRKQDGSLMLELMIAMAILVLAVFPMAYSFAQERKLAHSSYRRAVAMEIIDGEMEVLLAGEWKVFPQGTQTYQIHTDSATNLPPGNAILTVNGKHLRLEWMPKARHSGGAVLREAEAK